MNKNKVINKSFKKITLGLFIFVFICSFLCVNIKINASESYSDMSEKIYANVDISDDFDDSSVVVILDKSISGINKVHNETLFSNLEFEEINDLTYVTDVSTINNKENFEQILEIKLKYSSKENVIEMIEELILLDGVKYAGPNRYFSIEEVPNDPLYPTTIPSGGQWAHNNIQSENAWDFTTGNRNIRIGVIDTGVSSHPDLNANLDNGFDFVYMIDEDTPGPLRNDLEGHGTHVAGIIGAVGNQTTPTGMVGVNWGVTIVPMQVATITGSIDSNACIRAINYARDTWNSENRISILSMSIGWYTEWPEIETAIRAYQGLFVCSTGNKNQNNDLEGKHHYPSFYASDMHTDPIPNMIAVGRSDINDRRPLPPVAKANWGARTITIYAPGQNIISTVPLDLCNLNGINCGVGVGHIEHGYHSMSGSSMATPHVSGVAALLLSLNENLTALQLREAIIESADDITIQVANDETGVLENQNVIRLNAYNAVRYVLENYMNPTMYTLSNYSSTINTNKTIASDASYFDELNGFYKLNVTYAKSYEFISSSTSGIEVTLYDEDFTEIPFNDLDSTSNKVHFIENLSTGTYYLRVAYANEENIGTINTQIVSRTTVYLGRGDNDILLNTYNNISEYVYTNNQGPGIYRFKLNGAIINETFITYPLNSLTLYTDSTRSIEVEKLYFDEDEILVYLPSNGAYYLNINLNEANYSSLFISVDSIEKNNIDYINGLTSVSFNILFENKNTLYYYEEVTIKQKSEIQLDIITNGIITDSIPVYVYSRIYDEVTKKYNLVETFIGEITPIDRAPVYTLVLDAGTYYFGYKNNEDAVNINFALRRMVDYNMNMEGILVADPYYTGYDLGTEVLFNEGECDEYYITEGFTRNIYLMVEDRLRDPMSRLDYDWYSSNEAVATVTNYGTVLAMPVTTDTEVTIYAVLKDDPKVVYYRTFTVLNDDKEDLIEIELNMSYSYVAENGTYQLELTNINCPYPMIQYYSWNIINNSEETITMNYWGQISSTGTCIVLIEGTYNLNSRVRLYITLTVE